MLMPFCAIAADARESSVSRLIERRALRGRQEKSEEKTRRTNWAKNWADIEMRTRYLYRRHMALYDRSPYARCGRPEDGVTLCTNDGEGERERQVGDSPRRGPPP